MPSFPKNSLSVPNEIERVKQHFADKLDFPCYVVGNGPSATEVLLSADEIENSVIFRANWFFLEEMKNYGSRVDGFFWSVENKGLRENVDKQQRLDRYTINAFFQPFHPSDKKDCAVTNDALSRLPSFDHWAIIATDPTLARFMMGRPLPTQGMQMIAVAAILGFKTINVSGIDLYNDIAKRYAWSVPDEIKRHLREKDFSGGYEASHSLDLDLHFLRAIREHYQFDLVGLSDMAIMAPFIDRSEVKVSAPVTPYVQRQEDIYVTLADGRYVLGAMALARSLAKVTDIPLLVLHTDPYVPRALSHLSNVQTRRVEPISNPHGHGQARFASVFTKLRVFELLEYRRITFIDSDAIVLKNIDDLFGRDGFFVAPDWGMELTDQFNSGLISFSPSEELLSRIHASIAHTGSYDGGDQGFLNEVFRADIKWLPPEYNTLKRLPVNHPTAININDVKVLHFVGDNPWDMHQMKTEFTPLEAIWASFLEKDDWQHLFWMNKRFISKRWNRQKSQPQPQKRKQVETLRKTLLPQRVHSPARMIYRTLPRFVAKPIYRIARDLRVI